MEEGWGGDEVAPAFHQHALLGRGRHHPPHDDDVIAVAALSLRVSGWWSEFLGVDLSPVLLYT
jgi:hypothetical protein